MSEVKPNSATGRNIDEWEAVRMCRLYGQGLSATQIAVRFGITARRVNRVLRKSGIRTEQRAYVL